MLPPAQRRLLLALAAGQTLKAHRDIEGRKEFRLHAGDGQAFEVIAWQTAEALSERGLIDSNKKFPAATYWLTAAGRRLVEALQLNAVGGSG